MNIYFSDVFRVTPRDLERHGAFNISLVSDLPLFVDPFLIFNSRKPKYRKVHGDIVRYLRFLHAKARSGQLTKGMMDAWYRFPEITQNWLGFSEKGNQGHGLGKKFAVGLHGSLGLLFDRNAKNAITRGIHLEKLCLVSEGVGRDNVSDFVTNLMHGYLLKFTSDFAKSKIDKSLRRKVRVPKARFNYRTQTWTEAVFDLPFHKNEHVLLTPRELLTKDDTWINRSDLFESFEDLPAAIPNEQLRHQVNTYFRQLLPAPPRQGKRKKPKILKAEHDNAVLKTLRQFPELVDHYIRRQEDRGNEATRASSARVDESNQRYHEQIKALRALLKENSGFYDPEPDSYEAAHRRALFVKDVVENKGGHRLFYVKGKAIQREADLQIAFRFTWYGTAYDVSAEVNDGRGPADYKISMGAADKTIVEMKLASNASLQRNLKNQTETYKAASDAKRAVTMILCFSEQHQEKVRKILKALEREGDPSVVLIDGRKDNKPSGSKA